MFIYFYLYCICILPLLVVLYAVSAVYFAGVMVRLMLTLTPIVCVLASICISHTLDSFMKTNNKEGMLYTTISPSGVTIDVLNRI